MSTTEERLDTLQAVELAEGVAIRLRVAGPLLRAGAYFIDTMIRGVALSAISAVVMASGMVVGDRVGFGVLALIGFVMEWFYPMVFEAGRRGAHMLSAEVDENAPLFKTMRQASYAIYARQEIWRRDPEESVAAAAVELPPPE